MPFRCVPKEPASQEFVVDFAPMSQKFTLIGIVDDGSDLDPSMPRSTATTLAIPKGADVQIDVEPFYNSGDPVPFASLDPNWKSTLVIADLHRGMPRDPIQVQGLAATNENGAVIRFALKPTDTQFLILPRYLFDIWLTLNSVRYQIVALSGLRLEAGLLAV